MYFITEQNTEMWANMLKENFNVNDENKLAWVSQVAAIHELHESALGIQGTLAGQTVVPAQGVSPIYATPANTPGMGNPAAPSPLSTTSTSTANFYNQQAGSGDIPVSTLPMALNVALMTIGLELVPVVPSKGPWALLTYMDFPYTGGKLGGKNLVAGIDGVGAGRENKPLFVKVLGGTSDIFAAIKAVAKEGDAVEVSSANGKLTGFFKQWGRMDGGLILEVAACQNAESKDCAITDIFAGGAEVKAKVGAAEAVVTKVDYVQTAVDLIDGYANFATGKKEAMTRAQNETGTGNTLGLRLFSKWVEMGSYEVTGTVTRQQLQDLPLYGVDAISKVMEAMQNELTQHINQRILESIFALGVTNAVNQKAFQGVDLNLHMGVADKDMAATSIANYTDVYGVDHKATWGIIKNSEVNTSAENLHTRQRRIATRCLSAANLILQVGRRGRGEFIVTNAAIASALQDVSGYVVAPMANSLSQTGANSLYMAGTLAGMKVYVDPYMAWSDSRICVGRVGNGNEPGLVFMPYILADTVSCVAEGTMTQKLLCNSRFALTPVGFYPEAQYYTFAVDSDFGLL